MANFILMLMMKQLFLPIIAILCPFAIFAQMNLDEGPVSTKQTITYQETVKAKDGVGSEYFSLAKYKAERAAIRKERNTFEVSSGLSGSVTSLNSAWLETSGGDNTISTAASLFLKHKYTKDRFSVESSLTAKFGYYKVNVDKTDADGTTYEEGVWYKNQDEFSLSIAPSWSMSKNWAYSATLGLRSQFAKGYVSSSSQEEINLKSDFMSPGYLTLSLGVNYQSPLEKFPVKLTLAPLALNGIFVTNELVRINALYQYKDHEEDNWKYSDPYGVSPYKSSKFEGGSSLQIDFDRSFGKKATFRYITSAYSFYGWISNVSYSNLYTDYNKYEEAIDEWTDNGSLGVKPAYAVTPTVRWTNSLEIKATDYVTTKVSFELYYDRAQNTDIQTKTMLSLGLTYTFKNK